MPSCYGVVVSACLSILSVYPWLREHSMVTIKYVKYSLLLFQFLKCFNSYDVSSLGAVSSDTAEFNPSSEGSLTPPSRGAPPKDRIPRVGGTRKAGAIDMFAEAEGKNE